jgi:hypothetical protein
MALRLPQRRKMAPVEFRLGSGPPRQEAILGRAAADDSHCVPWGSEWLRKNNFRPGKVSPDGVLVEVIARLLKLTSD